MKNNQHLFHIPVMGTGYTADTPILVAPFGISSTISLVDDILLKRLQQYYSDKFNVTVSPSDGGNNRAERITAYLNTVKHIVSDKIESIKQQPFFEENDKQKYFNLLPDTSSLKKQFYIFFNMKKGKDKELEKELNEQILPGSIDVNIMVKLDRMPYDSNKQPLGDEFTDAKTALKGFAESDVEGNIVFSAGINQPLFTYMTQFKDFYRNSLGDIKKKIILKVSDFRSAMIQGKFLARKGLEVCEFRIESGLNCGGHTFPSKGITLFSVLKEFKEKRAQLAKTFGPLVKKYYDKIGVAYEDLSYEQEPLLTIQGGVATSGEQERLIKDFGVDSVGWGSPFLFVPEAVNIDDTTLNLIKSTNKEDFYLSNASPIGVPFNNIHNSGADIYRKERIEKNKPGSPCPKGFLVSNTEFSDTPICEASNEYQSQKVAEINSLDISNEVKEKRKEKVLAKECICDFLGNSLLIKLGISKEENKPQSICPGPNSVWFDKTYSLKEMVKHIYGRSKSLISSAREHMFVKEIEVYTSYTKTLIENCDGEKRSVKDINETIKNLEIGIEDTLEFAASATAYKNENIETIIDLVKIEKSRLAVLKSQFNSIF